MIDVQRASCSDEPACSSRRSVLQVDGNRGYSRDRLVPSGDPPRPPWIPLHRAIVAVDIVGSTTRANPVKGWLRQRMYNILNEALWTSGILERHHDPLIDRGDGALILIHPSDEVPKTLLLTTFIHALQRLLTDHNAHHANRAFQLRVALHAGEVHYDKWGHFGEALDITCRLLDAPELKRALAKTAAPMMLVVSDDIHRSIIRHEYPDIDHHGFHPIVRIDLAGLTYPGWVQMFTSNSPVATRSDRIA